MVNLWTIAEYHVKLGMADMEKVYDDLTIINLYFWAKLGLNKVVGVDMLKKKIEQWKPLRCKVGVVKVQYVRCRS